MATVGFPFLAGGEDLGLETLQAGHEFPVDERREFGGEGVDGFPKLRPVNQERAPGQPPRAPWTMACKMLRVEGCQVRSILGGIPLILVKPAIRLRYSHSGLKE